MADEKKAPEGKEGKKKKPLLLWIVIAAVLVVALGAGGMYFFKARDASKHVAIKKLPPAHYVGLKQFVSNLTSTQELHYIEVTIQLKTRMKWASAAVVRDQPEVRDAILNILSEQTLPSVVTIKGRNALRARILHAVNKILAHHVDPSPGQASGSSAASASSPASSESALAASAADSHPILGVYFTAFVVQ